MRLRCPELVPAVADDDPPCLLCLSCAAGRGGQRLRMPDKDSFLFGRRGDEAVADGLFPSELTGAAHGLGFTPRRFLRGLLVGTTTLHFPEDTLALHLLFENAKRLVDVVVAHNDLQRFGAPLQLAGQIG
jgi:hypothetical protein